PLRQAQSNARDAAHRLWPGRLPPKRLRDAGGRYAIRSGRGVSNAARSRATGRIRSCRALLRNRFLRRDRGSVAPIGERSKGTATRMSFVEQFLGEAAAILAQIDREAIEQVAR